jgi:cob(I)alamin adenosyltransferase
LIQIYTGCGKGKTTAAFGLALRASGAGLKVYIGQFLKCGKFSEIKALKKFKNIKIEQFGCGSFIKKVPSLKDKELAEAGFQKIKKAILSRSYDLVILDEINSALQLRLLDQKGVISIIQSAPKTMEIVCTGRLAPKKLIEIADLVSDIKEVKHYYRKGAKARKGIEY